MPHGLGAGLMDGIPRRHLLQRRNEARREEAGRRTDVCARAKAIPGGMRLRQWAAR